MAVALRELEDRTRRSPALRVVRPPPPTPRWVFLLRRLVVVAVAVGAILAVLALARPVDAAPSAVTDPPPVGVTVVIGPGDTLWDVAGRYAPSGRDRTAWVAEVAAANGVDAGALAPGTPIVVPVRAAHVTAQPVAPGR